jgi:hypothetical protein
MDQNEAFGRCICAMCPTYMECEQGKAFCMPGAKRSKCIKAENGCICPGCPVFSEMKFSSVYYCIKGSDAEQKPGRK